MNNAEKWRAAGYGEKRVYTGNRRNTTHPLVMGKDVEESRIVWRHWDDMDDLRDRGDAEIPYMAPAPDSGRG